MICSAGHPWKDNAQEDRKQCSSHPLTFAKVSIVFMENDQDDCSGNLCVMAPKHQHTILPGWNLVCPRELKSSGQYILPLWN